MSGAMGMMGVGATDHCSVSRLILGTTGDGPHRLPSPTPLWEGMLKDHEKPVVIKFWDTPAFAAELRTAAGIDGIPLAYYVKQIVHRAMIRRGTAEVPQRYPSGTRPQEEVLRRSSSETAKNKQKQETFSSPEAKHLTGLLVVLMRENMPDMKPTNPGHIREWEREADLMHGRDGRSWEDAEKVLRWCQADPFWKANIRSISKFRKKYETLKLKMGAQNGTGRQNPTGLTRAQRNDAAIDLGLERLGVDPYPSRVAQDVRPALPEGGRQPVGARRPGDLRQGSIRVVIDGPEPEV